jgi:superfamily II DNA/RNA helicase
MTHDAPQVVIGTHGKLKTWVSKRLLSLDSVAILVFDEADEMLKADGFADDSVRLIKQIRRCNPAVRPARSLRPYVCVLTRTHMRTHAHTHMHAARHAHAQTHAQTCTLHV